MPSLDTATALVISPTPASPEAREFFLSLGAGDYFADLAGLRRSGLGALRRCPAGVVVATAPPNELRLFEAYLVALAFLVPGARRERQLLQDEPVRLGTLDLLRSAYRLTAGLLAGIAALATSGMVGCVD